MMFRRMSFILGTVSMIAVLTIASWAIGLTSADTPPKQAGLEPVEVSQGDPVGVTGEEINVSVDRSELRIASGSAVPIPVDEGAEAERLRAYLLWKHNATPIETNETAASERLLEYLRWKHQVDDRPRQDVAESERLMDYLRWKHNGVSGSDYVGNTSAPTAPQSSVDTTRLQAYLIWAHLRDGD